MIEKPPSSGHSGRPLASALGNGAVAAALPLLLPLVVMGIAISLLFGADAWGEVTAFWFLRRGDHHDSLVAANYIALLAPPLIAFAAGPLRGRKVGLWVGMSLGLLGSCWFALLTAALTIS
jgi:hypothetical protein